jgi:hypothetical protein
MQVSAPPLNQGVKHHMERASAYAALATELEQWRLRPLVELESRIGLPPVACDVRIAGEAVTLEVSVTWADASRERLKVEAVAFGPSHWDMERLVERIIVPIQSP